jgi:alpha-N-arabinofuranosidase
MKRGPRSARQPVIARRRVIGAGVGTALGGVLAGCLPGASPAAAPDFGRFGPAGSFQVAIDARLDQLLHAANPGLCGTNIQWVDGGDGLLESDGNRFVPPVLERVKELAPTSIRYPGGSQSDVFDWRAGLGPLASRGSAEHFHRKSKQRVRLGTTEFLNLCEAVGAEPFVTVNASTLGPREAAEWLALTNVTGLTSTMTGRKLPRVRFWEIGNEPYLKEDQRPETWIKPADYARRATDFIAAMREVDPKIRIGVPLRSDSFNGVPVTPHPGFNDTVLSSVRAPFDFVSVHNAYMPFAFDGVPADGELYASMMASTDTVRADLDATREQVRRQTGAAMPMVLSEYNAMISLGKRQDALLASPAGALYVADLLALLAYREDMLLAHHWSLIGNWFFGALATDGRPRPQFEALRMVRQCLRGRMVPLAIDSARRFDAAKVGLARAATRLPAVTGFATQERGTLRLLLINKAPHASADVRLRLVPATALRWSTHVVDAPDVFATDSDPKAFRTSSPALQPQAGVFSLRLPPASIGVLVGTS